MRKKEKAQKLQAALKELYPVVSCSLDFQTPLELLAATCLSAQCTDERVNLVTKSLFARCRTAQDYRDIPQAELEEIIRSCGFYRNKAKNLRALGLALCERHGGQVPSTIEVQTELRYGSPFQLLVAVILSAQCTDRRVNMVTPELFRRFPAPEDLAGAPVEDVLAVIKSVSYPNSKAAHLVGMAGRLVADFGGEVPSDIDSLMTLPGVGRKTANVILGTIFHDPGIVADTHCIRLSNRFGLVSSRDPLIVERELTPLIPKPERLDFCHRLIAHGRSVCLARAPRCRDCTLRDFCVYKEKNL